MIKNIAGWALNESNFKFCRLCHFYPCELVPEYEHYLTSHPSACTAMEDGDTPQLDNKWVSYDHDEINRGCVLCNKSGYLNQVECGNKRVAEGIGDHYKIDTDCDSKICKGVDERWEPSQPVFISAQTGQGKNYFIENTLIPYVQELNYKNQTNQKILILSNRRALKEQIKKRTLGSDIDNNEDGVSYGEYVDIMTYQGLLHHEKSIEERQSLVKIRYLYVVCDEAHFFTSDAMFNPHTQKILEKIVALFRKSIRIYMSATPYECLEYIIKQEKTQPKYEPLVLYHFARDYSYLDVKGYSEFNEISRIITKSVLERREKWLVFIDNIKECERFSTSLISKEFGDPRMAGKVKILHAANKGDELYTSIVVNEKLDRDTYVLISTSVLDNGVNFRDIDNIVVADTQKAKVLQMAGRARVANSAQRKTLYIKRHNKKSLNSQIESLEIRKEGYHEYDMAYGVPRNWEQPRGLDRYFFLDKYYQQSAENWQNAKHWFGISREDYKCYINEIARSLMERRLRQYENIYNEMDAEDSVGQQYLEHQFSWFGKRYSPDDDITYCGHEKARKELIEFLEICVKEKKVVDGKEAMDAFSKAFIRLYDAAYGQSDKNRRIYGAQKMNRLLKEKELDYFIDGKMQKGPWMVCKTSEDEPDDTEMMPKSEELTEKGFVLPPKNLAVGVKTLIKQSKFKSPKYRGKKPHT